MKSDSEEKAWARSSSSANKLTPNTVVKLKRDLRRGDSPSVVASRYGISDRMVRYIQKGVQWAWIDPDVEYPE